MHIDSLVPDPRNVRRAPTDLAPLIASIKAQGVLMPILARHVESVAPSMMIVCGERRWRAAQAAGVQDVPVEVRSMTDAEARAAQLAENVQRAGMSPADEWQAVAELQEQHGYTLQQAGAALGLDAKKMRLMGYLGRMHMSVLDAIREFGVPDTHVLRAIASAPLSEQAEAVKRHITRTGKGKRAKAEIGWYGVRSACTHDRIYQDIAIFDVKTAGVAWEDDLFVEPGQPAIYTTDIAGFVAAQEAALGALIESRKADGWNITALKDVPKGFREYSSYNPDSSKIPAYEGDDRLLAVSVSTHAYGFGKVSYAIFGPSQKGRASVAVEEHTRAAPFPRPSIDKKGMQAIAFGKAAGVRIALESARISPPRLLQMLLIALSGRNVAISGESGSRVDFDVIARELVSPEGALADVSQDTLSVNAVGALQRMLVLSADGSGLVSSGPPVDWIGRTLDAGQHTSRFDTPEFLAHVSGTALKELAAEHGIPGKQASTLRESLVGKLPNWRPFEFDAPGPSPAESAESEITGNHTGLDSAGPGDDFDEENGYE